MKIKINLIFAIIAFPIGLALFKEIDLQNYSFRNPALGFIYLITFIALIFLTFKQKENNSK